MKKFVIIMLVGIMILSAPGCSYEDDVSKINDAIEVSGEELLTIPSMIVNEVDGLPAEEESAILTGATVGYSSQFYVYEMGMTYYRYDHWSENYYECTLSLPDGYTNGAIIWIQSGGGSGEAIITVKAANGDEAAYLNYLFISVGVPENQEPVSVELMNDEEVARLYKWMGTISSDHMDDLITYLSVSVKDLREIYGNMALEYTETGGSPVYSLENLSGILFVYTGSNTPLLDERIADEIILTSEYDGTIGGLSVGMNMEEASDNIVWDDAWFSLNQGAAGLQKNFDDFTLTLTITCEVGTTPTEENSTDECNEWKEKYLKNPTGQISEMRVEIKDDNVPTLSISSDELGEEVTGYALALAKYFREPIESAAELREHPSLWEFLVNSIYELHEKEIVTLEDVTEKEWYPQYYIPYNYMHKAADLLLGIEDGLPEKFMSEDYYWNKDIDAFLYSPFSAPMFVTECAGTVQNEDGTVSVTVRISRIEEELLAENIYTFRMIEDFEWGMLYQLIAISGEQSMQTTELASLVELSAVDDGDFRIYTVSTDGDIIVIRIPNEWYWHDGDFCEDYDGASVFPRVKRVSFRKATVV